MIRLANVLVIDAGGALAKVLEPRLVSAGYGVTVVTEATQGLARARQNHPDLLLIGSQTGDDTAMALTRSLKLDDTTADIPVLWVADVVAPELATTAMKAGCDDVIALDCDEAEMLARLGPLGRLATMHAELRHRATAAARLGVAASGRVSLNPADGSRPLVMVAGEDPLSFQPVLGGDAELSFSEALHDAEAELTRRNYDAAILDFHRDPEGVLGFCSQVRHNPRLFNLPIVVVANGPLAESDAYRRGASRVLNAPADPLVLKAATLSLVRRQKLRWTIREAFRESQTGAARDQLTGLYSPAFLDIYLEQRLREATASDRHLTVVCFRAPSIEGIRDHFGDDAARHLTVQLGQWIAGLLRAEDLVVHGDGNEFLAVLPDTPVAEAQIVMHRIAGVLSCTDFAVRDVYQPVKVWVEVGASDARAGDDVAALLARARENLE